MSSGLTPAVVFRSLMPLVVVAGVAAMIHPHVARSTSAAIQSSTSTTTTATTTTATTTVLRPTIDVVRNSGLSPDDPDSAYVEPFAYDGLEVGDCFERASPGASRVRVVACDTEHRYQFISSHDFTGQYDGFYNAFDRATDLACREAFERFTGSTWEASRAWYWRARGAEDGDWETDGRVWCFASLPDEQLFTGDLQGSSY
jgi:hypothetical protein